MSNVWQVQDAKAHFSSSAGGGCGGLSGMGEANAPAIGHPAAGRHDLPRWQLCIASRWLPGTFETSSSWAWRRSIRSRMAAAALEKS